jgi:outer membrane protein assembly factor BamB
MVLLGVFCITSLLTLQNGDAQQASSDWPMFQGNPWHSGFGEGTPVTSPVLLWKFNASSSVASGPAIVDGIIYFGSENGTIFALNSLSGAQIWNCTTPMSFETSPAVVDGVVYIGCNSPDNFPVGTIPPPQTCIVYALNAYNGEEIWNFSVDGWASSPTTVDGVVYFGTSNGNTGVFYALQATNGSKIWDFSDGLGAVSASPAVVDGVVYFSAFDGGVYALNASSGQEYWRTFTSGGRSSPAVINGVVYVGSTLHQIYALDAISGSILWNYTTGGLVWSSPAYANSEIYIGSDDGHLYCLDANTGAEVWNFTSPIIYTDIESSPVFCSGVVYFTAYSNLFVVNASSGTQLWNYDIGGNLADAGEIAVDGGVVYVGSGNGYMYAFGDSANSPTSTPTATPNSTATVPEFPTFAVILLSIVAGSIFFVVMVPGESRQGSHKICCPVSVFD